MPSFGAKLKQQREQQGVTLEEISQSTKISNRFLRALEEDRFDQLPGGIFNKGFIRAYARSVGLDEEETVAGYLEATGVSPEKPEGPVALPEIHAEAAGGSSELPWGALAVILLIAALVLAIWGVRSRQSTNESHPPAPVSPTVSLPEKSAVVAGGSPSKETVAERPAKILAAASSRPLNSSANIGSAQAINLQIRLRRDSWISIVADGGQIARGILPAESQRSVHAIKEIVVRAGNIGAVDFEFNGAKLPAQGADGEAKTLIFNASGFHAAPPTPDTVSGADDATPQ